MNSDNNKVVDLSGQVAVVTGATSGLGWRFAQVLAAAGATVAITGRRSERLEELKSLIQSDGGQCQAYTLDLTDADALVSTMNRVHEELGLVQILVNNAGIPDGKLAVKMSLDFIDQLLDTNVRAPYILACEVARRLIDAKKPGRIVNISSVAASHAAGVGSALYATSKGAISRMTQALAVEWSKYLINVNAIAPGLVDSEMSSGMIERLGTEVWRNFPRKRIAVPEQIDSTLLFLCSPASEAVTGAIIRLDDGQGPH